MSITDDPDEIDELLDQAIQAANSGDRVTASALAEQVLTVDTGNQDAEDLLCAPLAGSGELRRLTILFADLVNSTALSTRIEPEIYRTVIGRYREQVDEIVNRYEGHVFSTKGDGLLAVFGHPSAHENDVRRAVHAGLDITREVDRLSERVRARFGFDISVRVGVHRGMVYLDVAQDDVYGLGANLAARVSGLAPPGGVVVSAAVAPLVAGHFELEAQTAQPVKGIDEPVEHYRVVEEHIGRARVPLGTLVGRERELTHLHDSWGHARRSALRVPGVCFTGEAGMGKSRLATAAADLAEQSGRPVLALIGSPFHTDAGLHPVRTLLEQRAGIERTTEHSDRLRLLEGEVAARGLDPVTTVPLLAAALEIPAEGGYQPTRTEGAKLYRQIIEAVVDYLLACAGGGPAVLLAEDLQWFDASTRDVVESLLAADPGTLLVVLTAREPSSMPDLPQLKVFELAPLTAAQTDELITTLDPTLSDAERADVQRRCDGVPLYIEEVVAKLHQQPTDSAEWARVPDALYESLFSRLRASRNTIQVVEAAATIGREFDRTMLSGVLDMTDSDIEDAVRALVTVRVFQPTTKDRWRFRHELLREVAYELPPPSDRRRLHGRVADTLVGDSDNPDWHLVALHYRVAERFEAAADAHQKAAYDARQRGALNEACACLTQAIEQLRRAPTGPSRDRLEVLFRLRRGFLTAAVQGTSSKKAAKDFESCLKLGATDPRQEGFLSTMTALWAYYLPRGDLRRALRVTEYARSKQPNEQRWFGPTNAAAFGMVAWFLGDFGRARALLEEAVAAMNAAQLPDFESLWFIPSDALASMHMHLAMARYVQGDLAGAEDQFTETVRRAKDIGFPQGPFSHCYQRFTEIFMCTEAGLLDRAGEVVTALGAQAERHGFEYWTMIATTMRGVVDALSALSGQDTTPDRLAPHIATMTEIGAALRAAEVKLFSTYYDGVLAQLLIAAGDTERARECLDGALALADETAVNFYRAELLRLRAHTTDDTEARDADLRRASNTARGQAAYIYALRAAMDAVDLQGESARGLLAEAVACFPDDSGWPQLDRARTLLG
ncbi:ATP-binding protein [[Mycobacterium] crassicus]|uniref:Adenylate/guanylate cyclase domain-containing protein n=1 Tax=[Mycobacterium] crassicus TaxID=2872309 RepID=A0ABU5XJJ1_9MYCO|nr:adenylate/guanylate cyclase domain-containing protein [Mycolicibacter sp. MYC098]MEB3022447.1 adenylate/guanylate cyclase domain-containing protein [Mycolicibacter sp. MYC098]